LIDCFKQDVDWAVEFLGDIICNSTLTEVSVENERDCILSESLHVEENKQEFIMDNLHYTSFRYNSLGLPILGDSENIKNKINRDMIVEFKETN